MSELILVSERETNILHIRLNRPPQLNALNHALLNQLAEIFQTVRNNASVKGLLITGEGKGFCAGADINELKAMKNHEGMAFAKHGQNVFRQLETLGKPSIAAIHGFAFGGGCELAMAATLRICADNAVLGQPEIKLGIIPGFGGTQRLPRLIGKGRAMQLCLTGERFTAEEAYQWGFANELVAPSELEDRALERLNAIIKHSAIATQSIMTTIDDGYNLSMDEALALEAVHFALCSTTKVRQEGVSAFLEKREATFNDE